MAGLSQSFEHKGSLHACTLMQQASPARDGARPNGASCRAREAYDCACNAGRTVFAVPAHCERLLAESKQADTCYVSFPTSFSQSVRRI